MDTVVGILNTYGIAGVIIAAFFEAIFFPPPVEIILLPVMLSNPGMSVYYALITVLVSLCGSITGYGVGKAAGRKLLLRLFKEDTVRSVEKFYNKYGALAVITSAITPVPYEAYTLSAGVFKMNFTRYIIAVSVSRILRYLPEGIAVRFFGRTINAGTLTGITCIAAVIIFLPALVKLMKRRTKSKMHKT